MGRQAIMKFPFELFENDARCSGTLQFKDGVLGKLRMPYSKDQRIRGNSSDWLKPSSKLQC